MRKRPGLLIPVFFLILIHGHLCCQVQSPGTASAALGGSSACLQGYWCAGQNQAGLGTIELSSISIQHSMPYLLKELGISSLACQFTFSRGALGTELHTTGLQGFRQSSLWISYGLRLHPLISAGLGIHFWNATLAEQLIFAPGISFALGLQVRISEKWELGGRLVHPAGWSSQTGSSFQKQRSIVSGISYSFFRSSKILFDLKVLPEHHIILCGGMEWILNKQIKFRAGICSHPFTYSWGISLNYKKWVAEFSFLFRADTGISPLTSLTHAW